VKIAGNPLTMLVFLGEKQTAENSFNGVKTPEMP